jgi:uncharacterized repeat protein (TIGR01451 family)
MEMLENRQLLANDLGQISGTVFTDLTDNGFTGDDGLIQGAQVRLYLDGGNGTFDNGGGDDVEVTTGTTTPSPQVTDVNGEYQFDQLVAGDYFVTQDAFTGRLQRPGVTVQAITISPAQAQGVSATIVDSYDDTTQIANAQVGGPTPVDDATDASEALGGERDFFVDATSGTAGSNVTLRADTGGTSNLLTFATDPGTTGTRIVTYDGDDNDGQTLDPTGLGSVDLTASNAASFRLVIGTDLVGTDVSIQVFTDAGNSSSAAVAIPVTAGGTATEVINIRFSDFTTLSGGGADFTNVGAIRLSFEGSAAGDGEVDIFETVGPSNQTVDFANLNPISVGNQVFIDGNNNGLFDSGEGTINGVSIQLFEDTDSNDAYTDGVDVLVAGAGITNPVVTSGTGLYTFENLLPGNYVTLIADGQAALNGFSNSTGNDPASDPDDGVDNDDNGVVLAGIGVASAGAFTLSAGGEPTNDADTNPNTNTTIDFGFVPEVDVAIVKSAFDAAGTSAITELPAGQQATYRLTITNNGPSTANNVEINDLLPAGITLVSSDLPGGAVTDAPDGVDPTRTRVIGTLASLASGSTVIMNLVVEVDAAATGTLTNESDVASDGIDTDTANNDSDLPLDVNRVAVLGIVKSDTPDPVSAGGDITYTIVVTNQGPSTATNVVISDPDLADVTFSNPNIVISNPTVSTGNVSITADAVNGTVPTLDVGQVATITFVGTVGATFGGTTITNTATADADEADLVTANEPTDVSRNVDLVIQKDGPATTVAGEQLTYTFTVQNNGPSGSTGATVSDTLPTGLTFVSSGDENGVTGTFDSNTNAINFTLPDMASGATAITFTAVVQAGVDAPSSIVNSATVSPGTNATDTDTTNNSDDATTTINRNVDLSITKTDGVASINAGGQLTYTLVVTNDGPSTVNNAVVTDPQIAGLTFASASSTTAGVLVTVPPSGSTDPLTATIPTMAPGDSVTITVIADVATTARGTLTNSASVAPPTGTTETDTTDNTATDDTTITTDVVLTINKTDSVDPVIAGNALTYTIVVTNTGTSSALGVAFSDTLPAGVTFTSGGFVSPDNANGTVTNVAGSLTAAIGTLDPQESATVTVLVGVDGITRGTIQNTASATSTEVTTPVTSTQPTSVNASLDVSITKAESADPVAPGQPLTYTLVVSNSGPSTARNVQISDSVPAQLTVNSVSSTVGTVSNTGNAVTGTLGDLAPNQSVTITISTTVNANAQAQVTNTATVTTDDTETNTTNNSASVQTTLAGRSVIAGRVYIDANRNGSFDTGELGVPGVTITLTGTDFLGGTVSRTVQTSAEGEYAFDNLLAGTYTVVESQPDDFIDGEESQGTNGSTISANDTFTVTLGNGVDSLNNDLGEIARDFSKRRFLASNN